MWGVLEWKLNEAAFSCADVSCYFQGQDWGIHKYSLPGHSWIAIWESGKPQDGERGNLDLMRLVSLGVFHFLIVRELD